MAKKRKNEPTPRNFRNNPFQSLKGVSTRSRPAAAGPSARVPSGTSADDETLFTRAVRGVRPLEGKDEPPGEASSAAVPARHASDAEKDNGLFLQAMSSLGAAMVPRGDADDEDIEETGPRRSSSSRMRRLKRGMIRIAGELDLHGMARDEALRRLEHFLAGACFRGHEAVLVITGKGINSPDGPVLPAAVARWLSGPGRRFSSEFHQAPRDRGGSGAVVIFLRAQQPGSGRTGGPE